jgi:hypothetical protein
MKWTVNLQLQMIFSVVLRRICVGKHAMLKEVSFRWLSKIFTAVSSGGEHVTRPVIQRPAAGELETRRQSSEFVYCMYWLLLFIQLRE